MGQNKDIGKLIEDKLKDGKKSPKSKVWEKINTSLDREMRRKKRIYFYWLAGGAISVILGTLFLFGNTNLLKKRTSIPEKNIIVVDTVSNIENNKIPSINPKEDSLININEGEEKRSKIDTPIEDDKSSEIEISSKNNIITKTNLNSRSHKSVDETYTISKKYYYYNSKDGTQIITSNKNEIDSLILDRSPVIDSLKAVNKDSIAH